MWIYANIGSGNGLMPDDTKPLSEPMFTNCWGWGCHQMEISQEVFKIYILDMSLKIDDLSLQPHLSGANDFSNMWEIQWSVCDPTHAG